MSLETMNDDSSNGHYLSTLNEILFQKDSEVTSGGIITYIVEIQTY